MLWKVEAALRKMKNGFEGAGKDKVNIETLNAGNETIAINNNHAVQFGKLC